MKKTGKLLSLLLCAALLLCGLSLSAAAVIAGDVDGDGNVTSADARLALRASVKLETLSEDAAKAADADRDDKITSADARLILRASVKLETLPEIKEPEPAEKLSVVMVTDGGEAKDDGFNQVVYDSAKAVCDANGADFAVRPAASDAPEALVAAIDAAVEGGADVLVLPGFMFAPAIQQTVGKYPDVKFIAVDVSADDFEEGFALPANFYCAVYQEELCGYMAGFAAVKLGYKQLGFLGGMAVPSVMRYGYGFVQGADAAAAELGLTDVTVKFGYANQFHPDEELTNAMMDWYGGGTQIVFACGGGIYGSVAGAAKETDGAKLIGVDVDQAELIAQAAARGDGNEAAYMDLTVTSAVKNHGAMVAMALKAVFAGNFGEYGGRSDRLGMISADPEENAVQLAASTQFGDGFTKEDYAALTAKLFKGELTVDDDTEKAPADFATVITVEDVGNVK
ncbi:MAG: BMP family ABC transporter substrate-binding protein [Clostridia bacterium]|nr:BMP family ABC transporter substrate-binding protein [Clostridia bacterium]